MNKQREKTEQGIEGRVEKSRMEKIESRKEHKKRTEGTDNIFWNSRLNKHRKRGEIGNRVTYSIVCNTRNLTKNNMKKTSTTQ